jgi:hypothetical protein
MVIYKSFDQKLAVKGINSKMLLGYNIFFFILLSITVFFIAMIIITNSDKGPLIAFIILFLLLFSVQILCLFHLVKARKQVIIFDKKSGLIKKYSGKKYNESFIGKASHWYLQEALHKNHKSGFSDYHAVIVGNKGKAYIGLSAMSKNGLIKKLKRLNKYYALDFEMSTNTLTSFEIIADKKRWAGI